MSSAATNAKTRVASARRHRSLNVERLESREVFATVPLSFAQLAPEGWMVLDSQVSRQLAPGANDRLNANLAVGQSISFAVFSPSTNLSAWLVSPTGAAAYQLTVFANRVTYINPYVANTAGTWSLVITAPSNASATYTADVALNAGLEGRDSTLAEPRPLDATITTLPTGGARWAFMGTSDTRQGADVDYYTLNLNNRNGKPVSIEVTARDGQDLSGQTLELLDANGVVRAIASPKTGQPGTLEIPNYLAAYNGKYTLRLTSGVSGAYSVLVSDGPVPNAISASAILNEMVTQRLVTPTSVSSLVGTLSFDRVFQSLTPEQLLESLVKYKLVGQIGDAASLRALLAQRGIDLGTLRPDGVLTALATTSGGTVLKSGSVSIDAMQAKALLEAAYQLDRTGFLNIFTLEGLVGLFDDSIDPAVGVTYDPIRILTDKTISGSYPNTTVGYQLWISNFQNPSTFPKPADGVKATSSMPADSRTLIISRYLEMVGFGGDLSTETGYIDPYDASGKKTQNYLVWMDYWQSAATDRLSTYLAEYKRLGGDLDYLLIDIEDTSLSYWGMRTLDRRVDKSRPTTTTVWEELLADSRWPALKYQLVSRGIPESELTLERISTWGIHSDYAARWNAVMEERLATYLNRTITNTVLNLYPDAVIANYGNYYRAQTVPAGEYAQFTNSFYSLGALVGNAQSKALYGYAEDVSNPRGVSDPHRQFNARIKSIRFVQNTDSQGRPLPSGGGVITFFNPVNDVRPGDQIIIENRGAKWIDERYTGHFTVYSISADGLTLRYSMPLTGDTLPGSYDLSNRAQAELTAYVDFTRSYERFVSEVKSLRSQVAASDETLLPWVSNPDWLQQDIGIKFDHHGETVLHALLSGADTLLWWKYGWESQPQNTATINKLVDEANALIGYSDRRTISYDDPAWQDGYVMTGMEANGRRVYRFTPDPTASVSILSSSGTVRIQVNGKLIEVPNASIHTPSSPASSFGFWIVQTKGVSQLAGSVDSVVAQLEQRLTPQISGSAASLAGSTISFNLATNSSLVPANTLLAFDVDWTGDGKVDNTYIGRSGQQIAATFSNPGTYTVRVHTSVVGTGERLPTLEIPIRVLAPGFYVESAPADSPTKNLIFAGTSANETVVFQSAGTGIVDVIYVVGGERINRRFTGITGGIYAYGLGGNDALIASESTLPVWLYGGDGDDILVGGTAVNQLYGEGGNDTLVAGSGLNVLVGGPGVNRAVNSDGSWTLMPSGALVGLDGKLQPISSQQLGMILAVANAASRPSTVSAAALPSETNVLAEPKSLAGEVEVVALDSLFDLDDERDWL